MHTGHLRRKKTWNSCSRQLTVLQQHHEFHTAFSSRQKCLGVFLQLKRWPYNPVHSIIQWIRTLARDGLVVADMGCGDAKIALALSSIATVHSFDLVATNDRVTACNMAKVAFLKKNCNSTRCFVLYC